jgi:hypothetical protein
VQPEQVTYQPIGDRLLLRHAEARQRELGHEHQPAIGSQQPGRLRDPPVRIAPYRCTVFADHHVGAAAGQRHPLGVRLDQREVQAELVLQAARGGQLPGRDVHPDRARAAAGQLRRNIPAAAAELPPPPRQPRRPAGPAAATGGYTIFPGTARRPPLQFEALLTASRQSPNPADFALVAMLGLLGLRIFEATGADIGDLGEEHGHRVLRVCGKGTKVVLVPTSLRLPRLTCHGRRPTLPVD